MFLTAYVGDGIYDCVSGALLGTLNLMMPRCTDVGYERRSWGLVVLKDLEGDWYYLWFCLGLDFNCKISKEELQYAVVGGSSVPSIL